MTLQKIVLGSRNQKKCQEIAELLAPHAIEIVSVADFPEMGEVIEDGDTFAANAAKKATETAVSTGHWAIGEDSGLCVDALNGAPGIYSARFSGEGATDATNNQKLMAELDDTPESKRGAGYVCSVAVSDPQGMVQLSVEGTCRGRIITSPRGENGFGYDPYFLIPEYNATFGELGSIVKQQISHRARAFHRLIPMLIRVLGQD
jgi:XTP/dITP diphosphohydrolase